MTLGVESAQWDDIGTGRSTLPEDLIAECDPPMDMIPDAPATVSRQTSATSTASASASGWIIACVVAEGIGMTASAVAARASEELPRSAALVVVIAGGLIEGIALGVLQGAWLARRFPGLSRFGWAATTVLIAGLGWALASAPSVLADPGGTEPSTVFVLVMAAGLGLAMGALLGTGQALVLRGHVRHPWRWIGISAAAWTPTMVVIFTGATVPDASWSAAAVILTGALTGIVAGFVLGLVSIGLMRTMSAGAKHEGHGLEQRS